MAVHYEFPPQTMPCAKTVLVVLAAALVLAARQASAYDGTAFEFNVTSVRTHICRLAFFGS